MKQIGDRSQNEHCRFLKWMATVNGKIILQGRTNLCRFVHIFCYADTLKQITNTEAIRLTSFNILVSTE